MCRGLSNTPLRETSHTALQTWQLCFGLLLGSDLHRELEEAVSYSIEFVQELLLTTSAFQRISEEGFTRSP